jgi:pimeloyl-ACP methyl ester carboxylesterase
MRGGPDLQAIYEADGVWKEVMSLADDTTWLVLGTLTFLFSLWFGVWLRSFIDSRFTLETMADTVSFVTTTDGARLAVYRYQPRTGARPGECPIILCHGLGANRFVLDFDEQLSLARYLRGRGYDVFVLELRGAGMSKSPEAATFEDAVERDLPAAIAHVLEVTQAEKVNWVGHSLGGTVMFAALGGPLRHQVNAMIGLGAPSIFEPQKWLRRAAILYPLARPFFERTGTSVPRAASLFAASWTPGLSGLGNLRNIESRVLRRVMWSLTTKMSVRMLDSFVLWLKEKAGPTYRGASLSEHWAKVDVPLLLIAGQSDWLISPPAAVRYAYYHAASAEKEFVVLSKRNGFKADYGHADLTIGRHAPEEVFPILERFLWAHRRPLAPVSDKPVSRVKVDRTSEHELSLS